MFGNDSPFRGKENPKVQDAVEMEPWSFCSKYDGEMGETKNFWYVCLESPAEQYIWRKDNSEFQGYHKGEDFSPDFLEKIEAQQKRIEVGLKTGELIPNIDEVKDKTAEEFAKENDVTVKRGPGGSKMVVVDDVAYIWSPNDEFIGVQIAMHLTTNDEDSIDKEGEEDGEEGPLSLSEIAESMPDFHQEDKSYETPSKEILEYLIKAMRVIVGTDITREEAIQLYNHIKVNGGDIDSTPPPPFLAG